MTTERSAYATQVISSNAFINLVISNHLWLEHLMLRCLSVLLPKPEALFRERLSFPLLVALCEAHGAFEADFGEVLRKVNTLRNRYAHRILFQPQDEEIRGLLRALTDMKQPFYMSLIEPSEHEMGLALASISGYLERCAKQIGATDIGIH